MCQAEIADLRKERDERFIPQLVTLFLISQHDWTLRINIFSFLTSSFISHFDAQRGSRRSIATAAQ